MKMPKVPSLKPFLWVLYPAGVLLLILYSLTGAPSQALAKLQQKQQQNSENQKTLARLTAKLGVLKQVNVVQTTQDLAWMLQVMPERKQFATLVTQLRYSGLGAGATLVSYKSGVGAAPTDFALSADYLVPDYQAVQKLIATLENTLPITAISNVKMDGADLTVNVISASASISAVSVKIDDPLPDYVSSLAKLKLTLASYQIPQLAPEPVATTSASTAPGDPFGPLPVSN